ncbi:TRAP transporter substrate-binding protein DctP [Acuticoccus sp. MNP-M23]|uniref:TRAP transporter substrate-binding protein DctP n=1 Tax=Acuticoccus sp. MNP-M23 TaxID=3072793 RepID=UPI002815365A|nr:TRAP transporter substrate-binding protein DctP [Acuticoccus sp. MNP-M23]WMS43940.1 TRAP transporter substrate-binding protein DctP [Acuticoccus sp. MNP-M23]
MYWSGYTTRLRGATAAAALAAGLAVPAAATAQEFTMAIAHLVPEDMNNEIQPALVHFKSLVESKTKGEVEVEIFGAGQLGSEVETGKQAQDGVLLQSTIISSGAMSSFFPEYQVITAPFLFPNYEVAHAFFDGAWFANFMKGSIEESGLRFLGTFDDGGGFVAFTNNGKLIKETADLAGMKIRVEENPAHVATMKALGASATPLPWGEVITALSTGLADGQFNAPGVSKNFSLWEVNDYTTLSGHVYNSQSWLVSDKWFQSLPEEYKEAVVTSAREAIALAHGISALAAIKGWQISCEEFKECYVLPDAERAKMAEVARPAWREWIVNDFGLDEALVDEMLATVEQLKTDVTATDMERYGG